MQKPIAPSLPHRKRPSCARCLRPQRACICHWITPTVSTVELLVLQHPLEAHHAKGSARLLHLSILNSRLVVAEQFDDSTLQSLLYAPFDHAARAGEILPILLYPDEVAHRTSEWNAPDHGHAAGRYRLVVLDGTWRKSRKMLARNPLLQKLPRLALAGMPASRYAIRKAHAADQLSTLEATCHALMKLENDAGKYQALLTAFDGFVAQQQSYACTPQQEMRGQHLD